MRTASDVAVIDSGGVARARLGLLPRQDAADISALLALLADPVRLRLTCALDVSRELCVGDLALSLDVSSDSVSYALRLMRSGGLVRSRKQGTVVYNSLTADFAHWWRDSALRDLLGVTGSSGAARLLHQPVDPVNTTPATIPTTALPPAH